MSKETRKTRKDYHRAHRVFEFKSGDFVPSWLLRVEHPTGGQIVSSDDLPRPVFMANGKVAMNLDTGQFTMWPTSKYFRCLIYIEKPRNPGIEVVYKFCRHMTMFLPSMNTSKKRSKTFLRSPGVEPSVYTTLKCIQLPKNYDPWDPFASL